MSQEDSNRDHITRLIMEKAELPEPGADFTAAVMARVLALGRSRAYRYVPPISRRGWALAAAMVVLLLLLGHFGQPLSGNEVGVNLPIDLPAYSNGLSLLISEQVSLLWMGLSCLVALLLLDMALRPFRNRNSSLRS